MVNILVTGAKGQLGNEIRQISGSFQEYIFIFTDVDTLDVCNFSELDAFFLGRKINYIINCAAYTSVDKAETEKEQANLINVMAVKNLSKISNKHNCKLIHISTDYVFDSSPQNYPFREEDDTAAISVYGATKLAGEKELKNSDSCIIIRTSWLYSKFGNNILKTIMRLGKEREVLNFVFDQVGTPTYAGDLADAIIKIIDKMQKDGKFYPGIYHYSNEGVCSWYDFATAVVSISGLKCLVKPIETREYPLPAKRPPYSVLNKAKIKNTFQIEIPHWLESLKKCISGF